MSNTVLGSLVSTRSKILLWRVGFCVKPLLMAKFNTYESGQFGETVRFDQLMAGAFRSPITKHGQYHVLLTVRERISNEGDLCKFDKSYFSSLLVPYERRADYCGYG